MCRVGVNLVTSGEFVLRDPLIIDIEWGRRILKLMK